MSRTILDDELRRWEVFASTGAGGYPDPARIVFRCASDRDEPSRATDFEGDKSEAEQKVVRASTADLRQLLARSEALS